MFSISWKFALIKQVIKARVPAQRAMIPCDFMIPSRDTISLIRYNVHILKDPRERMIAYDTFAWNCDNSSISGKSLCFPTL